MVDQLIDALKLSLAQCNKYEDPVRYIYEINEVLSRYKSNLYLAFIEKYEMVQDPKEIFNARITLSWCSRPTFGNNVDLTERSPVLLHVNGLIPAFNKRINKERTYIKTVDISDIVSMDRIASIKTDWYSRGIGESELTPDRIFMTGVDDVERTSVYFEWERNAENRIYLSTQINSVVLPEVENEYLTKLANNLPSHKSLSTFELKRRDSGEANSQENKLPVPRHVLSVVTTSSLKENASHPKDHIKPISAAGMKRRRKVNSYRLSR